MVKENPGFAGTFARAQARGKEMRARASDIADDAAVRGRRVYDIAVNEAAEAMSSASDTVEAVGTKAHAAGKVIRKDAKRAARAITRGEMNLRHSDPRVIADAATATVRRHGFAFAVAGAAVLAFLMMRIVRR